MSEETPRTPPPGSSAGARRKRQRSLRELRNRAHEEVGEPDLPPVPQLPNVCGDNPEWIDNTAALENFVSHIREAGRFAYDTEFIREESYWPQLCVVQLATADRIGLVDAQADIDLTGVWELIADKSIEVILHAGSQDLEPVVRLLNKAPANIFDTQIIAGFAGLPYPLSLERLLHSLLDVKAAKGLAFTRWDVRPLSEAHQRYAADDVRYGPAMYIALTEKLNSLGHLDFAKEACKELCDSEKYRFDPLVQTGRVKDSKSLTDKQYGVLVELVKLRDEGARIENMPPRTFLRDDVLIRLAKRTPKDIAGLNAIHRMPHTVVDKWGEGIVQAIQKGLTDRTVYENRPRETRESPADQFKIDKAWAAVQDQCYKQNIAPALVTTRSEMADIYRMIKSDKENPADSRVLQGWRKQVVGDYLMEAFGAK